MMNQLMEERKQIAKSNEQVHEITQELERVVADLKLRVNEVQAEATIIGESGRRNSVEMGKVVDYLSSLIELNDAILGTMKDINVNVDNYREMSKNVEKIAQSINLLSLNASIEAARAGEAGRGFAVVASNIRNLSDESKGSVANAQQNDASINQSISEINDTLNGFTDSINALTDIINKTIEDVRENSARSENIQGFVGQVGESIETITSMIEKTNQI